MDADAALLSAPEQAEIAALMQALRDTTASSVDAKTIELATEALAKGTEAFAAERMNHSIAQALSGKRLDSL